jgi:hypothetical protein
LIGRGPSVFCRIFCFYKRKILTMIYLQIKKIFYKKFKFKQHFLLFHSFTFVFLLKNFGSLTILAAKIIRATVKERWHGF